MSADVFTGPKLKGYLVEFTVPEDLRQAIVKTRENGFTSFDAYSPYPLEEFSDAMGDHRSKLPWIVLCGGALGGFSGWLLQYWSSVIEYPMNIGGRPYNSWPAFIVVIFEMTILFAAFAAVGGMFYLNDLPKPYHPLFNVERFAMASGDRYFLFIEVDDPQFHVEKTRDFLAQFGEGEVIAVED